MKGFGNYETMVKIANNIDNEMSLLKMQQAQNYISMINVKRHLYDYDLFGFTDILKALNIVSKYIHDRYCHSMSEEDTKTGKNYHDVLLSGIQSYTGLAIKEIVDIHYMFDGTSSEIYFIDDKQNRLSIKFPNTHDIVYDIFAKDIDTGLGYEKFCKHCKSLIDGLDMTLYFICDQSNYITQKEAITSFPDKVSSISDFKKEYEQYLLDKEGVVLC